jgi:TonB family protein
LDPDAAGCVVAGLQIGPDGRVRRALVLQGAFTARVDDAQRVQVQKAIRSDLLQWTFKPRKRRSRPTATHFDMVTVGFGPVAGAASRTLVSPERQDRRLGDACRIARLADWGNRNAIAVEQAVQRRSDQIIVVGSDDQLLMWTGDRMQPPIYPPAAYMNGVDGCVEVAFLVREDGKTDQVKVTSVESRSPRKGKQSLGALEQATLMAVADWSFAPGPDNLERRAVLMSVPVEFSLGGSRPEGCEGATVAEMLQAPAPP